MSSTGTTKALYTAAACLLLAGCGPAAQAGAAGNATPTTRAAAPPAATSGAAAGGGEVLACGLISEQDASTALGHASGAGTSGGTAALSECLFDDSALIVSLRKNSKAFYDQAYASAHAKSGVTDLPGVGDSAFEAGPDDHCTLLLLKGTTIVSILLNAPRAQPSAAALAKVAASKL